MTTIDFFDGHGEHIATIHVRHTRVLSVKVDENLLREIDELVRELGYENRSVFIREALVFYLNLKRGLKCRCECG